MTHDISHAWRALRAMPFVSTVVIGSLAIGIGANTVVFSWLQTVWWKPLPGVAAAASLRTIEPRADTGAYVGASWPDYRDIDDRLASFQWLLAFRRVPLTIGDAPQVERAAGMLVSGNYFEALNQRPAAGRLFTAAEVVRPGGAPFVVLSYDCWQLRFNGAVSVIGRSIRINGEPFVVIGVAPRRFQGTTLGLAYDMWLPATMAGTVIPGSRELDDRSQRGYTVLGRLRQGVAPGAAQAELDAAMRELATVYPASNQSLSAEILPFTSPPRGPQRMFGEVLALLQALMLLVLVAVCGNTANLLLARASVRQAEFGVRLALGANRRRVAGVIVTEALMLSLAGAVGGVAMAMWGTQALRAGEVSGALPIRFETEIDTVGLAVAIGLGLLAAALSAVTPAWFLARMDPQQALRAGRRSASRSPLRQGLMGVQVALALLVLVAGGLLFQRFQEGRRDDPGFRADGVLLAAYDLTTRGADGPDSRQFASRLLMALRAQEGVDAAALAASVPLDIHGLPSRGFTIEGRARADGRPDRALTNTVSPGYWPAMGIQLLEGDDFAPLDDTSAPPQVIVNDAFVSTYLDGGVAIGRRLEARGTTHVIVGVVRTSLYDAFGEVPTPIVYYSYRDRPLGMAEIHLRTRPGAEMTMSTTVRRVVAELDASVPVYDMRTLSDHIQKNLVLRRVPARMFLVLGPLLLVLAAIGVYAVVDYTVAQRRPEIALRLALGASEQRVVWQMVRQSLVAIAVGVGAASAVAVMLDLHLVRGGARDVPVLVAVPVILMAVAGIASWLPARRASRVSPADALRVF